MSCKPDASRVGSTPRNQDFGSIDPFPCRSFSSRLVLLPMALGIWVISPLIYAVDHSHSLTLTAFALCCHNKEVTSLSLADTRQTGERTTLTYKMYRGVCLPACLPACLSVGRHRLIYPSPLSLLIAFVVGRRPLPLPPPRRQRRCFHHHHHHTSSF